MRILFAVLGTLFVGIGVVGAFLPVLPTTPFILLAAACYARASERFHGLLLNSRLFGPSLREWQRHRSVPRRTKYLAIALMLASFAVTIVFFVRPPFARVAMALFALGLAIYLYRLPSRN
jgi:uncharacterized membrane protein YbaN (DUF454 family)